MITFDKKKKKITYEKSQNNNKIRVTFPNLQLDFVRMNYDQLKL